MWKISFVEEVVGYARRAYLFCDFNKEVNPHQNTLIYYTAKYKTLKFTYQCSKHCYIQQLENKWRIIYINTGPNHLHLIIARRWVGLEEDVQLEQRSDHEETYVTSN